MTSEEDRVIPASAAENPPERTASSASDAMSPEATEPTPTAPSAAPSDIAPAALAGWYPAPSGGRRYWDGTAWLDIPEPPATDASEHRARRRMTKRTRWVIAGVMALALLAGAGGIAWKLTSDAAAAHAVAEAKAHAAAEAERKADNERAAEEREAAEEQAERDRRTTSVAGIEASVKIMAEGHAADGAIEGPILEVTCSPVDGGSLNDIAEETTVFECFAANKDNGDGTMMGYTYNATMNWTTGSYTYGLGAP